MDADTLFALAGVARPAPPRPGDRDARPYVRRVKGGRYQARVWVDTVVEEINLGLYPTEEQAVAAVRHYVRTGTLPPGVLPKFAVRRPDGRFVGVCRRGGVEFRAGPFADPARASRAIIRQLRAAFRRPERPDLFAVARRRACRTCTAAASSSPASP